MCGKVGSVGAGTRRLEARARVRVGAWRRGLTVGATAAFLLVSAITSVAAVAGRDSVVGEVVSVAADQHRLRVRKDAGGEMAIAYGSATAFLRARPGATTLEGATTVTPGEIAAGDRLLCRGVLAPDGTTLSADRVVVMARGDLEARREREREDWRRRGVTGVVSTVDPAAHEITIRATNAGKPESVVVDASSPRVSFRRYAAGSVRFADARPGSFSELAIGDQVRVLGDRTPGGQRLSAEQVVSGAFRVVRGVVTDVDAARGVTVRENGGGGADVTISVEPDALVRRLPPMMVARLLRSTEGAGTETAGAASAPDAARVPAAPARAADADEVLDHLPPVALADVKKGDEVAALGPRQSERVRLVAMKLVVWTTPSLPAGRGARGRRDGGEGQADAFSDLLGFGGETPQ